MSAISDPLPERPADPLSFPTMILVGGGFLYAVFCQPAIGQRGYPPIDPAWNFIPFLWFLPLLISNLCDVRPPTSRRTAVRTYALVTALFDAGTPVMMVPKHMDLFMLAMNMVFYAPYHLVVAYLLEALLNGMRRLCRMAKANWSKARSALRQTFAGALMVVTMLAPFAWREVYFELNRRAARSRADDDWRAHKAEIYRRDDPDWQTHKLWIRHEYDLASGFHLHTFPAHFGYGDAYNQRVQELLAQNGVPEWSMKRHLVNDEELMAMMNSTDMEEVIDLPRDVSDGIVLFRRGTIRKWNHTMSSGNDGLSIATAHSGLIGAGIELAPVFMKQAPGNPQVVFIREGDHFIGAFHVEGRMLSSASK